MTRLVADRKEAIVRVGARLYARTTLDALESRLVATLAESHRVHPLEPGVSLQHVRSRLSDAAELADHVIAHASRRGLVETAGGSIRAAGWLPRLSTAQRESAERIFEMLVAAGDEPPGAAEVAERFGADSGDLLRVLEREGRVVQVEPERYYAVARLTSLVDRLREGMQRGREYAPSELRDLLGFSRKFLIPFLEY